MITLKIKNQKEFNKIESNFDGKIEIIGDLQRIDRLFKDASIVLSDKAAIKSVYDNATIKSVYDNATIKSVYDNATIKSVYDNATIESVYDNATIESVYDNATIESVSGDATIKSVSGDATIKYVSDNAIIKSVSDNAIIKSVSDNATIKSVSDNATIKNVYDNAIIKNVYDNAIIKSVSGDATINLFGIATICFLYSAKKIIANGYNTIRQIGKEEINIKINKESKLVRIENKTLEETPEFNLYKKYYPVEIKGKKVIMYKAVHKKDKKYFSDFNNNLIYKIGEIIESEIDEQKDNSCSIGIHVSHKLFAINWGRKWDDMALLECEVPTDKIIVSRDCDGKVRTSKLKILKEVPKEEW